MFSFKYMPTKAKPGRPVVKTTKVFSNGSKHTTVKLAPKTKTKAK